MDEEFYHRLLDVMADGVYFVDTARRITFWNKGGSASVVTPPRRCWEGPAPITS